MAANMPIKGGRKMPATRFPSKSTAKATGSKISKGIVKPAQPSGFPTQAQNAYKTPSRAMVAPTTGKPIPPKKKR